MALFAYQQRVQQLLRDERQQVENLGDTLSYINTARGQVAGESQSIRLYTTLAATTGTQQYPFSSVSLGARTDIAGIINIGTMWRVSGSGQVWMRPRNFRWFSLYELNAVAPGTGAPTTWAQFGQGASGSATIGGSLFVSPTPDTNYTLRVDAVCYPVDLVDDTTAEALPYLWTDAVPYFAVYLAMLSRQTDAAQKTADKMFQLYTMFVQRARNFATPDVMPGLYPQNPDPAMARLAKAGAG